MKYPTFFNKIDTIKLNDQLGGFLGAFDEGMVEISFLDCVKLSGHSCPTVASAFLMVTIGLRELYTDVLPQRSMIKVAMRQPKDEGVAGVITNVISYVVGASDESGFKGIGGKFGRNNLVEYGADINGMVRLTRVDTGAWVELDSDTSVVPGSPEIMPLMQKCMQGMATPDEQARFGALWQGRVEAMLLDQELWGQIVTTQRGEES